MGWCDCICCCWGSKTPVQATNPTVVDDDDEEAIGAPPSGTPISSSNRAPATMAAAPVQPIPAANYMAVNPTHTPLSGRAVVVLTPPPQKRPSPRAVLETMNPASPQTAPPRTLA